MCSLDSKIRELLNNLRQKYGVTSLKAEFEAEGASFDEVFLLKQYADSVGLDLTLKIGGCEAIRDIRDAKKIGVNAIVAPMIESSYALSKFVSAVKSVYCENEIPKLFINIETITGVQNFDSIIDSEYFKDLTGIVMGRTDLLGSLNLSDSESDVLLNLVNNISEKIKKIDKKFIIGGNISVESDRFLNNILHLSNFETRKVMFDASILLSHKDFIEGINQALEFEIYWLESKISSQAEASAIDISRLSILKKRYQYVLNEN